MKLFLDSANLEEIKLVAAFGILDGVTTNPSLIKKEVERLKESGKSVSLEDHIKKILKVAKGLSVSLEVIGTTYEEMTKEGLTLFKKFNSVAKNVYIKIPVNPCLEDSCSVAADGIRAIKFFSKKKIPVNCTLVFTPAQAFLAAKAGAKFVSPFVGREDDYIRSTNHLKFEKADYFPAQGKKKLKKHFNDNGIVSGVDLIKETRILFDKSKLKCEILAASIRNKRQFREVGLAGADIATLPLKVIRSLMSHPKSVEGMVKFKADVVPEYARLVRKK